MTTTRFVKSTTHTLTFDGCEFKATLTPINMLELIGARSIEKANEVSVLSWAIEHVPSHVILEGLTDAAGAELTTADVFSNAYFSTLILQLTMLLLDTAKPQDPPKPGEQ